MATTTRPRKAVKRAAVKVASKKRAAAKKGSGRTNTGPAKKSASSARRTTKKTQKRNVTPPTRELNEHGFVDGSDSALMVELMLEGGFDRREVNDKIAEQLEDTTTRAGNQKNIPSLISGLLARLEERGYTVESHWRLVPPDEKAVKGVERRSGRKSPVAPPKKRGSARKPGRKTAPAKKRAAKKRARR